MACEVKLEWCVAIVALLTLLPLVASPYDLENDINRNEQKLGDANQLIPNTYLRIYIPPRLTVRVKPKESIFLYCEAHGRPSPVIHWLKDGDVIKQNLRHAWYRSEDRLDVRATTSHLFLDCAQLNMTGTYTCVAENNYHMLSATTQVLVQESGFQNNWKCPDLEKKPRIYMWSRYVLEDIGQTARLSCIADRLVMLIYWKGPNGSVLASRAGGTLWSANDTKFQISSNDDLEIFDLQESDRGKYSCHTQIGHENVYVETELFPKNVREIETASEVTRQ